MKNILKFFLLVCSFSLFTQSLAANEQVDLKNHFLNLVDRVVIVTQDKNLSKDKRNSDILEVLSPTFDFKLMAKLSLGKRAYKKLDTSEKNKFTELYVKRMEKSYSSKLDSYSNEKVEVKEIKQPKKNRIFLVTDLVNSDEKLEIVYKFYKPKKHVDAKDDWLIYDVEILGVSILKTDKAQFKEFLQTKSIHELMDVLSK
ncbi:MAG: ABC transporter substrate-binding protein [Campylobacterota bacterium]|nr:ABC transporter substrate-binding protein [Campylobacterota bacterium]